MRGVLLLFFFCFGLQNLCAQKQVAIYWDASYSMKDRQIDRELQYLDNYFQKHTTANVKLVTFSNTIILQEHYVIESGDWRKLKKELLNTIYDGATSYANLFREVHDEYLLFTDGMENIDKLKPPTTKPIYIISSLPKVNHIELKLITDLSSGTYLNLNYQETLIPTKPKIEQQNINQNKGYITGAISGVEGLLSNVSVFNKNSNTGTSSKNDGTYEIKAKANDVLVYAFLGKKTVTIRIGRAQEINILMPDINENLDEVVVTAEVEKVELVNTGNMKVDKRRLGYTIESIGEESISDLDTDLTGAVEGQFSSLEIVSAKNNRGETVHDVSQFIGRGKNMTILGNQFGLVVIDGIPLPQSTTESRTPGSLISNDHLINPDIIVDITYLKGLAATNKYGTIGANGVLLITTKNAVGDKPNITKSKPLGTTATYAGKAEALAELADTPYINALKATTTIDEAFNTYLSQRDRYGNNPEFYLDAHDYFKGWNNDLLSNRVLSNVFEMAYDNPIVLRVFAYKQQANGNYKDAVITFERVLKLKPKQAQSYKDLALAQAYANNAKEALKIYTNIDKNIRVSGSNFNGIKKTVTNDAKNLVFKHKSELNLVNVNPIYQKNIRYKTRIIFEWNDLDAEFDLNIINPQKRFFTWSHTNAENANRIRKERQQGYGLEEFYLTSSDVGEWTFNAKYYGKTSGDKTSTYIKITTYKNFGDSNQAKDIKVVRLDKKNIEQTIAKLVVN